jgi:PAS domain S-box-containing protein
MADLLVDDDIESIPQWYRGHYSKSKLLENAFESTDFFPELGKAGKWLHFTSAAIRDSRGNLVGAVTTLEDITDIKQAEDALEESRQQLGDIIDFLPDATLVIDEERRVIAWNRAMEEMTGIKAADILGKGNYEYALPFYGERRPILIDLVLARHEEIETKNAKVDKSTTLLSGEIYVPALMGTEAYLLGKASALRDSKGNIVGAIESIRDITERRRVEDALAQAEEKYRSIFENAITGIYQSTLDGRILNANQAFSRMLGYESPQELSNTIKDLSGQLYVHPERRSELLRLVEKEGMLREFEVQFFRKDRSIAWVALNLRAVRDSNSKIAYLEGTAQDITVRKALESRLLQTQKMEAVGTLAGGVAHDFNNILTAISGYSEMVKRRLQNGEISGYIERVLQACDRAKNLVGQILTFSRGMEHQIRPVDIRPLTAEAVKMLRATLPSTIEIRLEIESEVPAVLADPTHIHQVIVNLCTNAAHAMREKGGLLEVHLEKVEISPDMAVFHSDLTPGRFLRLKVMDTGVGIAPEIVHRIFDPFFTTKQQGEGTGLGLSVVYGIVKESKGTISVHSEPGVGSVFSVYLPAIAEVIKPVEEPSTSIPGGNERILFVDDEDILIELGRDILEDLGYKVVTCKDSYHALETFRSQQNQFDIVITDMTMPGMTGIDLARELLKIRSDIPIILCTGFSELVTEEKAKEIGIREFMMKPFTTKTIAELINKALGKS